MPGLPWHFHVCSSNSNHFQIACLGLPAPYPGSEPGEPSRFLIACHTLPTAVHKFGSNILLMWPSRARDCCNEKAGCMQLTTITQKHMTCANHKPPPPLFYAPQPLEHMRSRLNGCKP